MVFDLEKLKKNYLLFKKYFFGIKPYYAVKANPHEKIIKLLNKLGSCFDCASIKEIKICIKNKVNPEKISFGNTIKKGLDIKQAFSLGVKIFAVDSELELEKIAKFAICQESQVWNWFEIRTDVWSKGAGSTGISA